MEKMRYDLTKRLGLNFGKGKRALLHSFILKGKDPGYYHKTRIGLGYVSMPVSSDLESKKEVYHDSSSVTLSWDSDISVDNIFKTLSVNMVLTSHLEEGREDTFESKELIQSDTNLD